MIYSMTPCNVLAHNGSDVCNVLPASLLKNLEELEGEEAGGVEEKKRARKRRML